ncbi:response regulator [Noviherbaspirillum sp. CPCC 100848]|uniref:histidine kinase n=1 Tax=Noviherbaspirillum album TaxID=3080276 RepID=A0ABU6J2X4_9BURK|nr:response regulator [Noviherbaspirillum sp. CPCC 100848]MEC4717986.1 response regulator [Noviherbaspirillum sp. CPCC 100848]
MDKSTRMVPALLLGISVFVFIVDALTPLGYAEWMLYVIPVVLCLRQKNPNLPISITALLMPLLIVGYLLSPTGASSHVAIVNRSFAFLAVLGVAYLTRRMIGERLVADHLMWLERGRAEVARNILGEPTVPEISEKILHALVHYLNAQVAVFYRLENNSLQFSAGYAIAAGQQSAQRAVGQGLIGEVVRNGKPLVVQTLPPDYLRVESSLGSTATSSVLIAPITDNGEVTGVMEFGFLRDVSLEDERELMQLIADKIGSAIRSAKYRENLRKLLEQTQRQSEELQAQQEELRVSNEELEEQGRALMESQARLENQQAELEQTNAKLEEQAERLEAQKRDLLDAHGAVQKTADELSRANTYKSEFLANMSHELRTPLNSSLILSKILMDNKSGNLNEEQVRYAQTVYSSNNELLALINDILDLSKIESGHVDIVPEPVAIQTVIKTVHQTFDVIARDKGLRFAVEVAPDAPAIVQTDSQRLHQVLNNLISNACKFTEKGEVILHIRRGAAGRIAFTVSDTGIGIAPHQQEVIFEAFRQADGTTSRKYGGTGLGLSISRELAHLLGGQLTVQSTEGKGSSFTLEIASDLAAASHVTPAPAPATGRASAPTPGHAIRESMPAPASAPGQVSAPVSAPAQVARVDDRFARKRERLILAIEDDSHFSGILLDLVREAGFDCAIAATGREAIELAQHLQPSGILLDVGLPDQSGLTVLDQLKRDPATRHIPIHMLSVEEHMQTALEMGAVGYALKPVARDDILSAIARLEEKLRKRASKVLVVEDDVHLRESIGLLLKADDIEITAAGTATEALALVSGQTFDCMVLDLNLPDATGYELLEQMSSGGKYAFPPVIIYTGRALSRNEEQQLRRYSRSIIIKGAKSPDRLLDEVSLFLHRVESAIPPDHKKLLQQARQRDGIYEGRRILLVEDDVRNIFALTSVFEPLGAKMEIARNGNEALHALARNSDIDLVLMDLMMPEMDGITAMKEIRKKPEFERLPIIALTAKAMPDDRRNCLEAGANDYIAKPIDADKLVSLCRVWLPK